MKRTIDQVQVGDDCFVGGRLAAVLQVNIEDSYVTISYLDGDDDDWCVPVSALDFDWVKIKDLNATHVGQSFVWPKEQPTPTPFVYLGVSEHSEPSILFQQVGKPVAGMLLSVWGEEEIIIQPE